MKDKKNIFLTVTGVVFVAALVWWNFSSPRVEVKVSEPGADKKTEEGIASIAEAIKIGEFFDRFFSVEPEFEESWPNFRGSKFDNIYKSNIGLIEKFGAEGPKIEWEVELGEGHAGPAVYKGLVYVLDYDEELKGDMLRCFSLKDGKELWRRWYKVHIKRNHGISRTVPAVTEKFILTIGPRSHVMCVDRLTGDLLWSIDVEQDYSTEVPFWYTGQCPIIDNGVAIIATGGKSLLIGVDCQTGEVLWKTPNDNNMKMSHASVIPWEFGGTRMYVYSAIGGVVAVAAEGPDAGKILWQSTKWASSVVAPSAVCLPDGKVLLTAGYGLGSAVFQVKGQNGNFEVEKLYDYKPKDGMSSEMQTPILYDGLVYGVMPKDGGALRNQLVCMDPSDFRETVWSSGKTQRFGLGPYIIADDKLYVLNDDGTLTISKPDKKEFVLLDQLRVFEGHDAWGPIAVADGYMLLRDDKKMICMDIRK